MGVKVGVGRVKTDISGERHRWNKAGNHLHTTDRGADNEDEDNVN